MAPVIRNLPLRLPTLDASQANDMTPDEVTAWLNEREWREQMLRRQRHSLNAAFWIISAVLLLVIIACFTH